jgi:subtilase family serine protease
MNRSVRVSSLSAAFAVILLAFAVAASGAFAATVRVGSAPSLPRGARKTGAAAAGKTLHLSVALESSDPAGLEDFATEVSTPGSPIYGRYLSVEEFAGRFGATDAGVAAVRQALEARGLTVGAPGPNRLSLPVTATVEEAESAFSVGVDRVKLPEGRVAYANDRAPALPAAAAPYVEAVIGLSNTATPAPTDLSSHRTGAAAALRRAGFGQAGTSAAGAKDTPVPSVLTGGPQPCEEAKKIAGEEGLYTADEIASRYQFTGLYGAGNLGSGQTVAVMEFEPYLESDISEYQECYGTSVPVTNVELEGGAGTYEENEEEDSEAALDIEQIISLAPGTSVIDYEAPNEGPAEITVLEAWVQQNRAKVMSSSWGSCEPSVETSYAEATNRLLQEAATQGQTFFVAAGDAGSTDCFDPEAEEPETTKELAVDNPSDEPFATSVGGTRIDSTNEYLWNDDEEGGAGGGGVSNYFAMPTYQSGAAAALGVAAAGTGAPCVVSGGKCREVPDVSAEASPESAYIFFAEEEWKGIGGTSAAAPLWAAMTALFNADPVCAGHTIGFANPAIYGVAGSSYAADFRDITGAYPGEKTSNNMFSDASPYRVGPAYDMATGLGTPIASALAGSLCAYKPAVVTPAPVPPAPVTPPPPVKPKGKLAHASLSGLNGKPKLSFALTAASGRSISSVTVKLPAGLKVGPKKGLTKGLKIAPTGGGKATFKVSGGGTTLKIALTKPLSGATFKLAPPTITESRQLVLKAKSKKKGPKLKIALTVGETGGSTNYTISAKP